MLPSITLTGVAFIAGILTILAPCVLPVLPVILAGSVGERSRFYPFVVIVSLALSIVVFTLLLKASTLLLDIHPDTWKIISGGIVLGLGLTYLFPHTWSAIVARLGGGRTQTILADAGATKSSWLRAVFTGAALGPVFSTCSPTYALVLATVFPSSFSLGIWYVSVYAIGLAAILLPIALGGRAIVARLRVFADERGAFRRILGAILVLVGIVIVS